MPARDRLAARAQLGLLGHSRQRVAPARRRFGERRARAGLRHGLHLVLACPAGCAGRRVGRDPCTARDGAAEAGGVRHRVRARGGERGVDPVPRRELRSRRLRVRGKHLVRSVPLGSRGGSRSPAGRQARLSRERRDLHALLPGRARSRRDGVAPPPTSVCTASSGPSRTRWSSTCRTASGSRCCARMASTCSTSSSFRPPTGAPDPTFDYATTEWAHKWPAEEIWVARKRS